MKTLQKIEPKRRTRNVVETTYEITSDMDVRDNKIQTNSSLSYDLFVRYIGGGVFTNWDKSNFLIDGRRTFTKMDEIYLTLSQPLNKLHFYYNKGVIAKLKNHKDIIEEWDLAREEVIQEFYGEVLNEAIGRTSRNYNNEMRLCQLLGRDLILQHLYTSTELNDELIY